MSGTSHDQTVRTSVLIPCHNHAAYVGAAIESVLAQTLVPDEILVADDASTDASRDVVAAFGDRVRPFGRPRSGIGETYNFLVCEARGELVAFLESDDLWESEYLETCVGVLDAHPEVSWVSTARRVVDADNVPTGRIAAKRSPGPEYTTEDFLLQDMGKSWTPVARRAALLDAGPFVNDTYAIDSEMSLRFSLHHRMRFVDRPLYRYRRHETNVSGRALSDSEELLRILERFRETEPDFVEHDERNRRIVGRGIGKMCGRVASLLLASDPPPSREAVLALLRRAMSEDPGKLRHLRRYATVRLFGVGLPRRVKRGFAP